MSGAVHKPGPVDYAVTVHLTIAEAGGLMTIRGLMTTGHFKVCVVRRESRRLRHRVHWNDDSQVARLEILDEVAPLRPGDEIVVESQPERLF